MFPANVALYESGEHRVLFDTGYARRRWRTGAAGWAYRRLLPPTVPPGATAAEQVPDPDGVTHVVLSHLHPDHVGGLRDFRHAAVVVSEGIARTLAAPRLRDGVLRGLLPDDLDARLRVVPGAAFRDGGFRHGPSGDAPAADGATAAAAAGSVGRTADLFGDGSFRLVDLPGHAAGHLGALVEDRVLLAGDAAWGRDLLGEEARIRRLPRAVAHDHTAQRATAEWLLAAEGHGLRLVFSHDPVPTGADLLATGGPHHRGGTT